jgi:hypothetical protein
MYDRLAEVVKDGKDTAISGRLPVFSDGEQLP